MARQAGGRPWREAAGPGPTAPFRASVSSQAPHEQHRGPPACSDLSGGSYLPGGRWHRLRPRSPQARVPADPEPASVAALLIQGPVWVSKPPAPGHLCGEGVGRTGPPSGAGVTGPG